MAFYLGVFKALLAHGANTYAFYRKLVILLLSCISGSFCFTTIVVLHHKPYNAVQCYPPMMKLKLVDGIRLRVSDQPDGHDWQKFEAQGWQLTRCKRMDMHLNAV